MATQRLSRDSWIIAGAELLAEGGLGAIAVEPLAERLGATKGSFYWHFANREELVAAVLSAWTDAHTEAIIQRVDAVADPRERLGELFTDVFEAGRDGRIELRLLAGLDDPAAADAIDAVTRRRVEYVTRCFRDLGLPAKAARQHAVLAYSAYLGLLQAQHATGASLLPARERKAYLRFLEAQLFPRTDPPGDS